MPEQDFKLADKIDKLYARMVEEQKALREHLLSQGAAFALDHSWEYNDNEDILYRFESPCTYFTEKQIDALLTLDEPLAHLGVQWSARDMSYTMEELDAFIASEANHLLRKKFLEDKKQG